MKQKNHIPSLQGSNRQIQPKLNRILLTEVLKDSKNLPPEEIEELRSLSKGNEACFKQYLLRRGYGEPLAYIRGFENFVYNETGDFVTIQMDPRAYVTNIESIELAKEAARLIPE